MKPCLPIMGKPNQTKDKCSNFTNYQFCMFVCHFPDLQKVQGHVITKFRNIQKLFFQVKRIND